MRRTVVFVSLVSLLVVSLLGGCSKASPTTSAVTTSAVTTTKPATTTAATTVATTTAKPATTTTTTVAPTTVKPLKPLPAIIGMGAQQGSATGTRGLAIADGLQKQLGNKVAFESFGGYLEMFLNLRSGRLQLINGSKIANAEPQLGLGDFSQATWGPQALRALSVGQLTYVGFITTDKSGIKTMADVKGKRMAYRVGSSVVNRTTEGILVAHGLTWNDVKQVTFESSEASQQGLMDGVVDVVMTGLPTPKLTELDALQGAHVIPFNPSPEGLKRLAEYRDDPDPMIKIPKGLFPGVDEDMLIAYSGDTLTVYDSLDEDWAYQLTKAVYDAIPALVKISTLSGMRQSASADLPPVSTPWHPGAVRFYKEVGLWTPEHEKFQQSQLQAEKNRMAAWKPGATTAK